MKICYMEEILHPHFPLHGKYAGEISLKVVLKATFLYLVAIQVYAIILQVL